MKTYFGDLHNHCGITYGFGSLSNAIDRAKSQLDFCAFTGHAMWPDMYEKAPGTEFVVNFHLEGFKKLQDHWEEIRKEVAEANSEDFVTFQGYELHSREYGDHHLISIDDELPLIYRDSPEELVKDCGKDYRALRRSNLKEMYLVRYADDFKIFCRSYKDAVKAFEATKRWLKDRLGLDISPEKSKVINMEQRYSEYLGFKMKVYRKGKKYVVCSHMSDKAIAHAKEKISAAIKAIQTPADSQSQYIAIQQYNSVVAGLHNYYRLATRVGEDFPNLVQGLKKQMSNRLRGLTRKGKLERGFIKERYGKSKQLRFLNGHPLIPMGYVQTRDAQHKKKTINRYTPEGRAEIHKNLGVNTDTMIWLMRTPVLDKSIEFADNRISLFAAQYGRCAITGTEFMPYDIRCHHKVPLENGGTDKYSNLVLVTEAVHLLIHATLEETIQKYLKQLQLNKKQLGKLNKLRKLAGTPAIA